MTLLLPQFYNVRLINGIREGNKINYYCPLFSLNQPILYVMQKVQLQEGLCEAVGVECVAEGRSRSGFLERKLGRLIQ